MYVITRNLKLIFAAIGLVLIIFIFKKPEAFGQVFANGITWFFQVVTGIVEKVLTPVFNKILQV